LKQVRLLPVVIFAALALLVFKGIGLVTNGGYVLTGTTAVVAQEGASSSTDPTIATATDTTMTDTNPVMDDPQPTIATKPDGVPAPVASSEAPASGEASASAAHEATASAEGKPAATACPETPYAPPAPGHVSSTEPPPKATDCPPPKMAVNEHGDALPLLRDKTGNIVPLDKEEGDKSEQALLQKLGDRRAELDKREADLAMRESLVAAAEKKLDAKTKELADLQAQVASLVDQKQASEAANFKAIVSMYENMKPRDAAKIFDTLDINVLIKVAQAMNPRKMSPILGAMSAVPAQMLTTALAMTGNTDTVASANPVGQNLAKLPQIVGH
jgi:flagellar motility protein MotE (MotC chaperone)